MRLRLVLAALLATLAAAGLAFALSDRHSELAVHPVPPSLRVGIVANALDNGTRRGEQMDLAASTGARWIREEFRWFSVEPEPGDRHWVQLDHLMIDAAHRNLHVLPLLLGTPAWQGSAPTALPRDPAAYARFTGAVVNRYGPGGVFWRRHPTLDGHLAPAWFELWNEPYLESGSTGGVDPVRYAAMVVAAASAARTANPAARLLLAAETTYKDATGETRPWLDALFAAQPQLGASFDAVAVHPYSPRSPLSQVGPDTQRFSRIDSIRGDLQRLGAGPKPLWLTEIGWSTCSMRPDCVSESEQARDLAALLDVVGGRYAGVVQALFLYRLEDTQRPRPSDALRYFGLLRHDGTHKPAFGVLRRATTR